MRRAKGSLLHRSLIVSWIAAVALGLGGCVWDGGHHHRNRGWWGWDDGHRQRYDGDRHRHDRKWDRDHDRRSRSYYYDRSGPAGRPRP